ncbi:ATP-binding cassette domain-containing protein [Actinomadura graeca]|uniref:ATP-binding cassette domain-containing protein n=1 Tax=Actinomadura graeca TaxID=2750812 RepID=A0ABX8R567_9ACTN|nr:ATP-binding cassette domain-containing protein [Actinomadura graeca]QXJ26221.1 ATP-binding cassette domain-containing protein [Actinomadura graeca]
MPAPEGLRVADVTVRFGSVMAVDGAGLTAHPGTVTGLVGRDGAGKTTLCDVIAGLRRPAAGTVHLDGRDLTGSAARVRARHGIVRAFQRPAARPASPFGAPTVRESVQAAVRRSDPGPARWGRRRGTGRDSARRAEELLARVGIAEYADRCARDAPPAVAVLTQLARALAADPAVLLLDEAWTGLPVRRSRALEVLLRDLAAEGVAVLVACGALEPVMGVCDVLHVLDAGRVIAAGPPAEVRADRRVRDACPA